MNTSFFKKIKSFFAPQKTVLFYRDFGGFTGGHLKVWHYFKHVLSHPDFTSEIFFSQQSQWDDTNPWKNDKQYITSQWQPDNANILFLAGLDWQILPPPQEKAKYLPIINFIQGMRHAEPIDPRFQFLKNKAIRICVSQDITDALTATKEVNGPIYTIENGLDIGNIEQYITNNKTTDLLIAGMKNPELACKIADYFSNFNISIETITTHLPRALFLKKVAQAKTTLFLPFDKEGFFLPALEGMGLGTYVICPDCIGNRDFCLPNYNCFRPDYTKEAIIDAVQQALQLPENQLKTLLTNAQETFTQHSLESERQKFLAILDNIDQIW